MSCGVLQRVYALLFSVRNLQEYKSNVHTDDHFDYCTVPSNNSRKILTEGIVCTIGIIHGIPRDAMK